MTTILPNLPALHAFNHDVSEPSPIIGKSFQLDRAVFEKLPLGIRVVSCDTYGFSVWTVTSRIKAFLANNEQKEFFLKTAEGEQGKMMLEGEYNSMVALYRAAPSFVPEPYAWGQLSTSSPSTYFFLCEFIEMTEEKPDPVQLSNKLVALHKGSVSPNGMFGFHINTCQGNLPQDLRWNKSWQHFFVQLVRGAMRLNTQRNGTHKNLEKLVDRLISHVVPKVLGPLEADGRSVKPCLIHGDLWGGNIGTSFDTREIYSFDASVYYAHHEMELAIWRGNGSKGMDSKEYLEAYQSRMNQRSEPWEQFEDRAMIYTVYLKLHASACHNGSFRRDECYDRLKILIAKYAPFGDEDADMKDEFSEGSPLFSAAQHE